jgi:uncharacterized protein YjiS (DUF1127 family)
MSTQKLQIGEEAGAVAPNGQAQSLLSAALAGAGSKIWACIAAYIYRRALRRAESALMTLDDRTLRDIGLTRDEIPAAVRRANANLLVPIVP